MGCSNSKDDAVNYRGNEADGGGGNHLDDAEIKKRIEDSQHTRTATFGGIRVRYAYLTQRGWYPDDPNKPNQDAFSVTHNFNNEPTDAFFGVYDGHGRDGDLCANFCRNHLPATVEKVIQKTKTRELKLQKVRGGDAAPPLELSKDMVQAACLKAHVECNQSMHRSHALDDSLSGTTSVSLYVHGRRNRITICNVGDSRAILGQRAVGNESSGQKLRALPLSRDQTPYRRDERIRIKKTGARILSLDQIEGLEPVGPDDDEEEAADSGNLELGEELDEGGDPPRVWHPNGEYPGTAFTRSMGDAIAEELGVFAEPEMLTREMTKEDKIIVLASDGVFEFLTNQSVIDMCAKFDDPLEACRAVVAEAYELWIQYELRTDDITMICFFVDGVDDKHVRDSMVSSSSSFPSEKGLTVDEELTADDPDEILTTDPSRPVRSRLSKAASAKLKQMKIKMAAGADESDESMKDFDLSSLYTEKTPEEKKRIAEAIHASVMFQNITDEQREMIFGVMEPIPVKKGTWVIKQGTVGDRFYIVDSGRFEVRIVPDGEEDPEETGGNIVHVYEGSIEKRMHPSFGELALMYSAPRAASIIAETDGHLWALHRYAFRQVLVQQSGRKELIQALKKVKCLKKLNGDDIKNIAAVMDEVTFGRGESITKKGDSGNSMYVILSGTCESVGKDQEGKTTLKAGDCFGDEVLEEDRRYRASVVAVQSVCCWKIDRSTFKKTIGG